MQKKWRRLDIGIVNCYFMRKDFDLLKKCYRICKRNLDDKNGTLP